MNEAKPLDTIFIFACLLALTTGTVIWLGAATAATITGHNFNADAGDIITATHHYLTQPANPTTAWNQPMPSAAITYTTTAAWAAIAATAATTFFRFFAPAIGYAKRTRLGADPEARLSTTKELANLYYRKPTTLRFVLGTKGRRTLATTNPQTLNENSTRLDRLHRHLYARHRATAAGHVAILGLSQSGKSQHLLTAARELTLAGCSMICSSVKGDLLADLLAQRRHVGQVGVFDPSGSLADAYEQLTQLGPDAKVDLPQGWDKRLCVGWTPLDRVTTYDQAVAAAHRLTDAAPDMGTTTQGDFWQQQALNLLAPLMYAAARTNHVMGDVADWINNDERPDPDNETAPDPTPLTLLDTLTHDPDPRTRNDAKQALDTLYGLWGGPETSVGSIYMTARSIIKPWLTEQGRQSSANNLINLEWLLNGTGQNTLFISSPPNEQRQLRPVLAGSVSSILDEIYRHIEIHGPIKPGLVVLLDEIGNAPLKKLPEYLSTLASGNVLIVTVWQNVAQIKDAYKDNWPTILSNSRYVLALPGAKDPDTVDWIAKIIGDESVNTTSKTQNVGQILGGSLSDSEQRISLIPANVQREMAANKALLIAGNNRPAAVNHIPEWTQKKYQPLRTWPHPTDSTLGLPHHHEPPDTLWTRNPTKTPATNQNIIQEAFDLLTWINNLWPKKRTTGGNQTGGGPRHQPHHPSTRRPQQTTTKQPDQRPQPTHDEHELQRVRRHQLEPPDDTGIESLI